jgi:hypothetical protein
MDRSRTVAFSTNELAETSLPEHQRRQRKYKMLHNVDNLYKSQPLVVLVTASRVAVPVRTYINSLRNDRPLSSACLLLTATDDLLSLDTKYINKNVLSIMAVNKY